MEVEIEKALKELVSDGLVEFKFNEKGEMVFKLKDNE